MVSVAAVSLAGCTLGPDFLRPTPPGVTGYTTGRPPVREVFAYWPALIAKSAVTPRVEMLP